MMCAQQKVNQFHTTLSEKKVLPWITEFKHFSQKATSSMIQDKKNSGFLCYLFFLYLTAPNTFTINLMSSPHPLTPVLPCLNRATPRWRSPLLQRKKRRRHWVWAQVGQSEPSVGTKGSVDPLSRLFLGGCAGSWQPQ